MRRIGPGMRILFVFGHTNDAILQHGILEQGLPFLQKPFTARQLRRKVREVLPDGRADGAQDPGPA